MRVNNEGTWVDCDEYLIPGDTGDFLVTYLPSLTSPTWVASAGFVSSERVAAHIGGWSDICTVPYVCTVYVPLFYVPGPAHAMKPTSPAQEKRKEKEKKRIIKLYSTVSHLLRS